MFLLPSRLHCVPYGGGKPASVNPGQCLPRPPSATLPVTYAAAPLALLAASPPSA